MEAEVYKPVDAWITLLEFEVDYSFDFPATHGPDPWSCTSRSSRPGLL